MPVLISHFVEHKENDNMNFWEYLGNHYGGHEKDADWDTDMKLPFMQHSDLLHLVVITPKNTFILQCKNHFLPSKNWFSFYKDKFIITGNLATAKILLIRTYKSYFFRIGRYASCLDWTIYLVLLNTIV